MKIKLSLLALLFCLQPSFADTIPVPDKDDKSTCQINGTVIELKTVGVSSNNPEYKKEAELMPGLKARFSKLYVYYGKNTYVFQLIVGDDQNQKIVAMARTTVNMYQDITISSYPTLTLKSEVNMNDQPNKIVCNFIVDGNKDPE